MFFFGSNLSHKKRREIYKKERFCYPQPHWSVSKYEADCHCLGSNPHAPTVAIETLPSFELLWLRIPKSQTQLIHKCISNNGISVYEYRRASRECKCSKKNWMCHPNPMSKCGLPTSLRPYLHPSDCSVNCVAVNFKAPEWWVMATTVLPHNCPGCGRWRWSQGGGGSCLYQNMVTQYRLILCLLRVWGNGARCVGPIHTVYRDLELRGKDRWKLEESQMEC